MVYHSDVQSIFSGRVDQTRESGRNQAQVILRLISLLCHHPKAVNNILMPTLSQYVNLYLIRSYDSLYCVTRKSQLNIALELWLLIQSSNALFTLKHTVPTFSQQLPQSSGSKPKQYRLAARYPSKSLHKVIIAVANNVCLWLIKI